MVEDQGKTGCTANRKHLRTGLLFKEDGCFFKLMPGPHLLIVVPLGDDSILSEPGRPQCMQPLGKLLCDGAGVVPTPLRSDLLHELHGHPELV